ncbi:unnamed protein product [Clonostachys byssicola]|uniref:Uncharacterized protein n=1 Tax=Clonostachys byssicola TaxID=160290 RepID=A0A9N9YAE3_9HYPO|nr:unnamed protein product [Clonostachys byssicola]
MARWQLEHPQGVRVGVLEQVFGSQSLASSVERLLFVRAQIPLGIIILMFWSLSPLGGQAGLRLLSPGEGNVGLTGQVYYLHPSYQVSTSMSSGWVLRFQTNVNSLYSASLISSAAQKKLPQDLWGLPRIPQWREERRNQPGEWYEVEKNSTEYVSLLGLKVQGLALRYSLVEYNYVLQTSYVNFHQCIHNTTSYAEDAGEFSSFSSSLSFNFSDNGLLGLWEKDKITPSIIYRSTDRHSVASFTCDMEAVVLETEMRCRPDADTPGCLAVRQRRIDEPDCSNQLLQNILGRPPASKQLLQSWVNASGTNFQLKAWPTDAYLAGEDSPYGMKKYVDWADIAGKGGLNLQAISRRMTTSFNTFWWASLNPVGHTNISFSGTPENTQRASTTDPNTPVFLNSTDATAIIKKEVYFANRHWVAILTTTTLILELMALLGFVLRFVIRGPDILGFASSLTRENPYTPIAAGGTGLNGPDRARKLKEVRIQLLDVRPDDRFGHIAVRELPKIAQQQHEETSSEEEDRNTSESWRPLPKERLYS